MAVQTEDAPTSAPAAAETTSGAPAAATAGTDTPVAAVSPTPVRATSPILDRTSPPTTADAHAFAAEPIAPPPKTEPGLATNELTTVVPTVDISQTRSGTQETPSLPPRPANEEEDPNISALRGMFPDFDVAVLQSVVENVHGDQDRAIDVLLGMNDPSYVSQNTRPHLSETSLDEEFARRLALEEESRETQRLIAEHAAHEQRNQHSWVPGVPAQGAQWNTTSPPQAQSPPPGQKDAMTEITEQFGKIAESGRKTFSSLFAKVKQKVQEFETQQTSGFQKPQYGWDTNQNQAVIPPGQQPPPTTQRPAAQAAPRPTPQTNPSYFSPAGPSGTTHQGNTPSFPPVEPTASTADATQRPHPTIGAPVTAQTQGFSTTISGGGLTIPPANAGRDQNFEALAEAADKLSRSSSTVKKPPPLGRSELEDTTPRPPSTSTGPPTVSGGIDPGKIGLLPKRPVSLLPETTSTPGLTSQPSGAALVGAIDNAPKADVGASSKPERKLTSDSDDMYV